MVQLPSIPIPGWLVSVRLCLFALSIIHVRTTAATHQVYANGGEVWDATLNQTDLSKNANKCVIPVLSQEPCSRPNFCDHRFYVLQLLHPISNNSSCLLFTRWGRVGESGSSQRKVRHPFPAAGTVFFYDDSFQGPFTATTAISEFKKQFKSKTATSWEDRRSMISAKSGKTHGTPRRAHF